MTCLPLLGNYKAGPACEERCIKENASSLPKAGLRPSKGWGAGAEGRAREPPVLGEAAQQCVRARHLPRSSGFLSVSQYK